MLFSVHHSSAARVHTHDPDDRLIADSGSQKKFPECFEIAKSTYPGGCDPKKSVYACYALQRLEGYDVDTHWRCSEGFDKFAISDEDCKDTGIYAGACEFSVLHSPEASTSPGKAPEIATTPEQPKEAATTSEKVPEVAATAEQLTEAAATTPKQTPEAATTPGKASEVATTPAATTPEQPTEMATTSEELTGAATTPEQLEAVATTPEQLTGDESPEGFPECWKVAKSTYPGSCDPKVSAFACYSTDKAYRPTETDADVEVDVPWACSNGYDKTGISKKACPLRPWVFEGEVNGKHVQFTAQAGIYAGACQFATAPEKLTEAATTPEQSTEAATTSEKAPEVATTPEQSTQAGTTPEQPTEAATTPTNAATTLEESTMAATTPMQPSSRPTTTTTNGATGTSAASLFTTVLGLAACYLQ